MALAPSRPGLGAPRVRVNLQSDTQTLPTPGMKAAMMAAELGDEQFGTDPSVWALCDRVASLLGKPAGMFLPSGTMCNQISLLTHCRPGDEVLAHESAHVLIAEGGGTAALSGAQIYGLQGPRGQYDLDTLKAAIRVRRRHSPPQTVVAVEQTAASGGGTVWPLETLRSVSDFAHEQGMATHMDGARLLNASMATGVAASDYAAGFDSVWLDFSKGLGAPIGAVLCGSEDFIDRAWRWKQRLGGAMRQAGICAAAGVYALDHHVERLAEDHAHARVLAAGLKQIPGIALEMEPETNIIYFDTSGTGMTAEQFLHRLEQHGVSFSIFDTYRGRCCTHLDISRAQIDEAIEAFRKAAHTNGHKG